MIRNNKIYNKIVTQAPSRPNEKIQCNVTVCFETVRFMDACCNWLGGPKGRIDSFDGNLVLVHVLGFDGLKW